MDYNISPVLLVNFSYLPEVYGTTLTFHILTISTVKNTVISLVPVGESNWPLISQTLLITIQLNLSYVTFQGNIEIGFHKTGGH